MRLTFYRGAYGAWLIDGTVDWFWAASERASLVVTVELDFLSGIDTTWIMGRGIAEWLGWPL